MKIKNIILAFLFSSFSFCANYLYAQKRIQIIASHAIKEGHNTVQNYKNIEEAGFTLAKEGYPSIDEAIEHLKTAEKTKVKLIISCPELFSDMENSVVRLKVYKSFAGYEISDEPKASSFYGLGIIVEKLHTLDSSHFAWFNLFPIFTNPKDLQVDTYEEYVQRFIEEVKPSFISFDCYGISKTRLHPDYFNNLEIISEKSKKSGLPFWAYVLTSHFNELIIPTKGTLSFQAYCNLAYGAQGLSYFSYRRIIQPRLNIHISPVDTNYNKMPIYYDVKELNSEINYYSKFFYGNDVEEVTHLGAEIPKGCRPTEKLPRGIRVKCFDSNGFVVSHFWNGKKEYLLFVNKNYNELQNLQLESEKKIKRISYFRKERKKGKGVLSYEVQPGSIILLRI